MKKIIILSTVTIFLLACSVSSLPFLPQPTLAPATETPIPFPTETITPAIPPTYTFTPTMIGAIPSITPTVTPSPTGTILFLTPPTETFTPVPTSAFTPTVSLVGTGFNWVNLSTDTIHWGSCEPQSVDITAEVTDPTQVHSVEFFVRFRDKKTGETTAWDVGTTMDNPSTGTYSITLKSSGMTHFTDAWIIYQLVASNTATKYEARTQVYKENLTLSACP